MITLSIALPTLLATAAGQAATKANNQPTPATNAMAVTTNPSAPVRCSKTITIAASPERVWQVLTAIDVWATWQKDIANPKLVSLLQPGATFTWKTGGAAITSTIHTVIPAQAFGWTGKTYGMRAIHNWTLTPTESGTLVTVDESMEGLLASLLKKSFNKNLAAGMQHWLELLKMEVEKNSY